MQWWEGGLPDNICAGKQPWQWKTDCFGLSECRSDVYICHVHTLRWHRGGGAFLWCSHAARAHPRVLCRKRMPAQVCLLHCLENQSPEHSFCAWNIAIVPILSSEQKGDCWNARLPACHPSENLEMGHWQERWIRAEAFYRALLAIEAGLRDTTWLVGKTKFPAWKQEALPLQSQWRFQCWTDTAPPWKGGRESLLQSVTAKQR